MQGNLFHLPHLQQPNEDLQYQKFEVIQKEDDDNTIPSLNMHNLKITVYQ